MNTSANKKDFFYIVVLILTFITVMIGATFAAYSSFLSQKKGSSFVYTGTFGVEYLSGDIIKCNFLKPMEEVNLDDESNVYKNKFKVTNTGTLDGVLEIVLEINKNEFNKEQNNLMYSIYDEEGLLKEDFIPPKKIEEPIEIIVSDKINLKGKETKEFILVIWIKENGKAQNEDMKRNLIGQIRIDAVQKRK